MKSNLFKKATALGVAASMLLSTSAFATVSTPTMVDQSDFSKQSSATGSGTLVAPVYKVKVPTSFGFYVDPFELSAQATGSALNARSAIKVPGYGYAITNQSNIAVAVDVEATLATVANVFVVPSNGAVNTYTTATDSSLLPVNGGAVVLDDTNKEKEISLFMLVAKSATISTATALFAQPTVGTTYSALGALEVNFADSAAKPARAQFLLDKGILGPDGKPKSPVELNAASTAFGAFSFQGDINQYAAWTNTDIKVAVKYTFSPVPETNKVALATSPGYDGQRQAVLAGTAASCENAPVQPVTPVLTGAAYGKTTAPTEILLGLTAGAGYREVSDTGSTVHSMKITNGATTVTILAAEIDLTTFTAPVIKTAGVTKIKALPVGSYPLEFITKNGRSVKTTLVVSNS